MVNRKKFQLETLQEQLEEIKKNVEEQNKLSKTKAIENQAMLETLEIEFEKKKNKTKLIEGQLEECQNTNNELLKGIEGIYELLKCNNNALLQLLGNKFLL